MRTALPLLLVVVATLTCARNPATGKREIMLVSENQEIAMGKENDPAIVAQMGLVADSGLQRYVSDLGMALARKSERPNLPWSFRVLDDPTINAFAVPGGFIYVTRGILAHMNSEAELVMVLGHEVGHVTARHSAQQMTQQQLAGVGLMAGMVLAPELAQYAGAAQQGLGMLFLKFGRDDERQSDALGLRYMLRTGHDPRHAPAMFTMLARVSAASPAGRVPTWQSSHPDPEDRRGWMERAVAALPAESLGRIVNREGYLQRITGLVYGNNPREGFFRGNVFLHPELQLSIDFPSGWQAQNQRQRVVAVSEKQDAVLQVQIEGQATSPEAAARSFYTENKLAGTPQARQINGLPAQAGEFQAQTEDGSVVAGAVAFVSYRGAIYRILGFSPAQRWGEYGPAVVRTIQSFRPLTDQAILRIQPRRVTVVTLPRAMTVAEFAAAYPGPVGVKELALLNNVDEGARFAAGERVKRVVGDRLPQ